MNAARYFFGADPVEVSGFAAASGDPRFREVPELESAVMRFPGDRLATFTCGFGEGKVSEFRVVGTKGDVRMDPAFSFTGDLYSYTAVDGKTTTKKHPAHDQVAGEIDHFAERVLAGEDPEPDGREGLIDVTVMDAIMRSVKEGQAVKLPAFPAKPRPTAEQGKRRPPAEGVTTVNATAPDGSE